MLAPRKNARSPTPFNGLSAPIVVATAIVPGPVVNGKVSGKNASCIGSSFPVGAATRSLRFWSGCESFVVKSWKPLSAITIPPAMRKASIETPKKERMKVPNHNAPNMIRSE